MNRIKPGWIYPLLTKDRYDDEFGTGFDHIAVPDGPDTGSFIVVDAWVVNAKGDVHPGLNASPIPIHINDIDVRAGKPHGLDLPTPRPVFGSDWLRQA